MKSTVREAVLDSGRALEVPESVTEAFLRLLRPCVYLCPYDCLPEELKKDARPAGGLPRLPEGMEPPLPVPHAVTVDCAVIPTGVLDIAFPAAGHLVIFADVADYPAMGAVLHLPAGTETVEHHTRDNESEEEGAPETYEPFPLYAVPGTTQPDTFPSWSDVPEAVDYAEGDAERARLVDELIERIGDVLEVPYRHDIQLGGHSGAWQVSPEEYGHVLFARIPESAISDGDNSLTLVTETWEQIAGRRYDELAMANEC
ncbi:hypothetical protein ACF08M_31030 [Streptomyces sp. NPDC015032]|uniref:hypothetical protein n=1 Tax=Streptomyces sp. NPDC015032 TaxID=3364937 RepID=UPI0036FE39C0